MALNPLSKILEENKLTGPNFTDWLRNLRIVLNLEKIGYVLDQDPPLIGIIPDDADVDQLDVHNAEVAAFNKWKDDDLRAKSYVLAFMTNELQRQHEKMPDAKSMVNHLQELYGEHSRIARYEVTKALFRAKLQEGGNVGDHVLNVIGLLERLEELNIFLDSELEVDLILQSLPDSFGPFIMNFHMNKLHCSKSDLHNMLCIAHATMKGMNTNTVLLASSKSNKKRKNKKDLRRSRELTEDEIALRMGNGARVAIIAFTDNLADPFSIPLIQEQLDRHLEKMRVTDWL
ncbi:uncharacterized protein LOC116029601 [Ipomoea triloba]|uniref:uncharacterized protein LOC116029601 n=1 Tax=Ipomoea triloba TaxID=35885 RepID=UPI00125E51D7|nr:uncharacterized protein LOC116029601 [Ipomoea triloba]